MDAPHIVGFYDKMDRNNILLSFKGEITSELVTSVLQIIETKLGSSEQNEALKKRVFYVLMESLQNLHHHAGVHGEGSGIFAISKTDGCYGITTGNIIPKDNVSSLETRLEEINAMTPEELKKHRQDVLADGKRSTKGGGGLGMIEIARRTGKLDYEFLKIDDASSFFCMNVKLGV
jgi:hypothetical protein